MATGLTMISMPKETQFVLTSDESQIPDVESFMEVINEDIKKLGIDFVKGEED